MQWRKLILLLDKYSQYRVKRIEMLTLLQTVWNGHLGWISAVKRLADFESPAVRPSHFAQYCGEAKAGDIHRLQINVCAT